MMEKIFKGMENGPEAIDSNFNELVDPKRDQTVNNITANGYLISKKNKNITISGNGLTLMLTRVNTSVYATLGGQLNQNITPWSNLPVILPVGYRPNKGTQMQINVMDNYGLANVQVDGGILNRRCGFWAANQNGSDGYVSGFGSWTTSDDFPE